MDDIAIQINNVSKEYRLGQIGGTTLKEELQSRRANRQGKENPNVKIGVDSAKIGEKFLALDNVNISINKGERVGIIGRNGAGKSTLLKLLCRVTAPSQGTIGINGRITSMLEVGTGFHSELTGRENVFLNGAILGMKKKEIEAKMEDIIDFSGVRQFIDTPVKRYSSGMFVKLAFSVAAHLESEIMIMDEVLAVGDVEFQTKCLNKMNELSKEQGKTILYVSHNMSTIKQLCNRCIVLEHGNIIYDGSVEEGISKYLNAYDTSSTSFVLSDANRPYDSMGKDVRIQYFEYLSGSNKYNNSDSIEFEIGVEYLRAYKSLRTRIEVYYYDGTEIGIFESETYGVDNKRKVIHKMNFYPSLLPVGKYYFAIDIYEIDGLLRHCTLDHPSFGIPFEILDDESNGVKWVREDMGYVRMGELFIQ